MIHLDLSAEEKNALLEILEDYASDLQMEITDTENWIFKEKLHARRDIVNKILSALKKT